MVPLLSSVITEIRQTQLECGVELLLLAQGSIAGPDLFESLFDFVI